MTDDAPNSPNLDLWSCIRRDFLAGEPATMLAERYAISERTIRRHAALNGWRRRDAAGADLGGYRAGPRTLDEVVDAHPSLAPVLDVNADDLAELLLHPHPNYLRQFAFKRAAEEAALDRPGGCLAWMRVVEALNRSGDRLERDEWRVSPADRLRAAFMRTEEDWDAAPSDDAPATRA